MGLNPTNEQLKNLGFTDEELAHLCLLEGSSSCESEPLFVREGVVNDG